LCVAIEIVRQSIGDLCIGMNAKVNVLVSKRRCPIRSPSMQHLRRLHRRVAKLLRPLVMRRLFRVLRKNDLTLGHLSRRPTFLTHRGLTTMSNLQICIQVLIMTTRTYIRSGQRQCRIGNWRRAAALQKSGSRASSIARADAIARANLRQLTMQARRIRREYVKQLALKAPLDGS